MTDPGTPGYGDGSQYDPLPLHYSPGEYGEPTYPTPGNPQPPVAPRTGSTPAVGGGRTGLWWIAVALVLAVAGVAGYFLFSGTDDGSTRAFPVAPGGSASLAPPSAAPSLPNGLPSIALPSIALPSVTVPSIGNYCASSISPLNTAATYIGAIEIGTPQLAQSCVYRSTVSPSVATRIGQGGKFYAPSSTSQLGPIFDFVSTDRTSTVQITVTKESDGRYYVTKVALR